MNEENRLIDRILAFAVAALTVVLLFVWPFSGVHPCAWEDTAIAAGLLPQGRLLPAFGSWFSHLLFSVFPHGTALFLSCALAKLMVGGCAWLAYGTFARMMDIVSYGGVRDYRRRRLALRLAAAVSAFAFACSEPMWLAAQGLTGTTALIWMVLLSSWCFTRLLMRASYAMAVVTLMLLGLICAETPFGWGLLALYVLLAVQFLKGFKNDAWNEFLDPVRMQKTKWSMTFFFLGSFVLGVLFECFAFASLDGLRAAGITASDLPLAYVQAYVGDLFSAFNLTGGCLLVFAVVIPFVLTFLLIRPATDEEQYLSFKHAIVYALCGGVAFLQLSPYSVAWFWNQGEAVSVSRQLLLLAVAADAAVLAWALFVLCIEVLCRDYTHIENVLYQGFREDDDDRVTQSRHACSHADEADGADVKSVRISFGRILFLVLPVLVVALIASGRRLPEDRHLQRLLCAFVDETVQEASGTHYLFTDGAFDPFLRLEAMRMGVEIRPVSLMGGSANREAYIRSLGTSGFEDRMSLEAGAAETLRTWVVAKSERLADVSVQLAFEFFRLNRRLKPVVYGLLVRPEGGDIEAAGTSVARCRALSDAIVAAHDTGTWRHAKNALLKDRVLFAQFRLAVMSRLRAINLDTAGRVKESIEEIAYSDKLNACNPSLVKIVRRMDWVRRQNGEDLTPREGLEVAMKRLDFTMARRYAQPVLREDPDEPNANFAVGMSYYAEEQFAKAEEYLMRVLKRHPKEPAVYNNLALVCLRTGRLEEAEKHVSKALELKPDQPEIKETKNQIEKAKQDRLSPLSGSLSANPLRTASIPRERVGVCSWSWQKSLADVADEMQKADVRGIHLALGPFIAPDKRHGDAEGAEVLRFVKAKIAAGEWKLMSTMIGTVGEDYTTLETIKATGGIVPDQHWAANQAIVTAGAKLTQELGCPYMSAHAGFLDESDPVAFAKYVERVSWMRDECAKYGVTLILESGQETAEDLAKFMQAVPGVGINFDPANMILYAKGEPLKAVRLLAPWIRQVHVKDACVTKTPGTWGTEVAWGTGEVGGKAFLAELAALGYKGNYVVEREAGNDRPGDIRKAIEGLTK